jgi:hypothetical protein
MLGGMKYDRLLSYHDREYNDGVSVTENLKAALQEMSTQGNTIRIWIDALCINQMISTGVRMRSSAWQIFIGVPQKVIAWLGLKT